MPQFIDTEGQSWGVRLNVPAIEEVKEKTGINLVDLDNDPLVQVRNQPMKLAQVIQILCSNQAEKLGISPNDFGRILPFPPDVMLDAVREAIIDFFPTGRASHVREVLTKYDEMNEKTDAIALAKMKQVLEDPMTAKRIESKADSEFTKALNEMFPTHSHQ